MKTGKLKQNLKNLWHQSKGWLASILLMGGATAGNIAWIQKRQQQMEILRNYSMIEAFRYGICNSIGGYIEQASYDTDTIAVNRTMLRNGNAAHGLEETSTASSKNKINVAYGSYKYKDGKKRVILNYFKPDTLSDTNLTKREKQRIITFAQNHNSPIKQNMILAHEFHHQACFPNENECEKLGKMVNKKRLFDYDVTPEEDAKLCFHNEITADINAFLYLREVFLQQKDTTLLEQHFPEYGKAVKNGQIHPGSASVQEKNKERLFITKFLTEKWKKEKSAYYETYAINQTCILIDAGKYKKVPAENSEYPQAVDFAYTFIMDGELVNLNYIKSGEITDVTLSSNLRRILRQKITEKQQRDSVALVQAHANRGR